MSSVNLLPSSQHRFESLPELSPEILYKRREGVFLLFAGLFLGSLTMLNILGLTRFIDMVVPIPFSELTIPMPLAVGVLPYPITFLCTDFISELYGRRRANLLVFVGLILNLWVVLILWVGAALPGFSPIDAATGYPTVPTFDPTTRAFNDPGGWAFFHVKHLAFGAVAASMIAYLAAQFIDVQLFHFWKRRTNGKHLWLRNNGSTLISQLVDTVAVMLITHFYAHALPVDPDDPIWPQLFAFIGAGYTFKVVSALVDTIPFYVGAHYLSRFLRVPPPTEPPHPPAAAAVEAGVG